MSRADALYALASEVLPGGVCARREQRRSPGETAEEEVPADLPRVPHRAVEDGKPVIRSEIGLRNDRLLAAGTSLAAPAVLGGVHNDLTNAATAAPVSASAAAPTCFQMLRRSRVVTIGSGGSP